MTLQSAKELIGRYFPGWEVWVESPSIGITDGKWIIGDMLQDVLSSTSSWYLMDMAQAIDRKYHGNELQRVKTLWAQEPV